jgi:ApaG protein
MIAKITAGLKVSVETQFQEKISDQDNLRFVFAYRVTIENHNDFPVQLLRRNWFIFDSIGEHTTVEGDGVVGKQPILYPEATYQYISGCNLKSDFGAMHGFYTFENTNNGELFSVDIPKFELMTLSKMN